MDDPRRDPLRALDAEDLGDLLAEEDVQERRDRIAMPTASTGCSAHCQTRKVAVPVSPIRGEISDSRSGPRTKPLNSGHAAAELRRQRQRLRPIQRGKHVDRAPVTIARELLQAATADTDQGELGGDEKGVRREKPEEEKKRGD
jgi:hypothetical protein